MTMKTYYMLTKPGIILGNVITTAGGFALASQGHIDYTLFLATLIGLALVVACAGILNNCTDRAADAKMARTQDRPLVTGEITLWQAIPFAVVLGASGLALLASYANALTAAIAFFGLFTYLTLYAFMKYRSFYGTLVGSIAGAVPPVVGYCAVSGRLDVAAALLFFILVFWQMPHFFAIAIYRLDDYKAAAIPVLPAVRGIHATKVQMALYIIAFIAATLMLTVFGYTGYIFAVVAAFLGMSWLGLCLAGFNNEPSQDVKWARGVFLYSLVVIVGVCVALTDAA